MKSTRSDRRAGPKVYDKAKYHMDGTSFPADLRRDQAYVHTGFFLGWLVKNGLLSRPFAEEFRHEIERFLHGEISAPDLFRLVGGVFADDMVSDKGRAFCDDYFDLEVGRYLPDYVELLASELPSHYHVADTVENFEKISSRVTRRYQAWERARK